MSKNVEEHVANALLLAEESALGHKEDLRRHLLALAYAERDVILASGKPSRFYIDCKKALLTAVGHYLAARVFLREIVLRFLVEGDRTVDGVAGVVLGGCPIVSAVSMLSVTGDYKIAPLPAIYVRKEAKDHGTKNLVEWGGVLPDAPNVVICEDVVTTGESTAKAVRTLRAWGANVLGSICLVDREEEGQAITQIEGVPVYHIFTRTTLLGAEPKH